MDRADDARTAPSHWRSGRALVAVSLLLGSLPGAWLGASWATRMRTLHPVLGVQRVADLTRRCTSALLTMSELSGPRPHRSHRWLV